MNLGPILAEGEAPIEIRSRGIQPNQLSRRAILIGAAGGALLVFSSSARATVGRPISIDTDTVRRLAEQLAGRAFEPPAPQPAPLQKLSYDQWRQIRFRPARTLWLDDPSPFKIQFFHPGHLQQGRVEITLVDDQGEHALSFDRSLFDYGDLALPDSIWQAIGYAGFRVHHELGTGNPLDEVLVFLGASYFRAIGKGQVYGLSARGLAVDTGLAKGEEFPFFRRFWIVKPKAGESTLVIHALLDSQSLTGAYRFELRPGAVTNMEIEAEIFPRRPVAKLGIAPLTSMFLFGEAGGAPARDYRPEVHDSDGLLLQNGDGERIWRPLVNPRSLSIAAFRLENPRLLALLQRDRNFDHYQDLESQYQRRPSAWIEPVGDWNSGRAELVQIPADRDIYDNVVSFWVPKEKIKADRSIRFRYRLSWSLDASADHVAGRAVATRWAPHSEERKTQFIVDFDVNGTSASAIDGVVTATEGAIGNLTIQPNPGIGTRLAFDLTPHGNDPVELRGFLRAGGNVLSETWSYAWPV